MVKEHDGIVLSADLPVESLEAGNVGTVVHIHPGAAGLQGRIHNVDRPPRRSNNGAAGSGPAVPPTDGGVHHLDGVYATGILVTKSEMAEVNTRLLRSATLPKNDIIIKPKPPRGR